MGKLWPVGYIEQAKSLNLYRLVFEHLELRMALQFFFTLEKFLSPPKITTCFPFVVSPYPYASLW